MEKSEVTTKKTIEFLKKKLKTCDASEEPFYSDAIETLEYVDNAVNEYLKNTADIREWQKTHVYFSNNNKRTLIDRQGTIKNR
jgi:predicted transglutaminase-like cysteine proteinase